MPDDSRKEIAAAVYEIVRQLAPNPVEVLDQDTRLEADLEYDSLALVELAVKLEERFELPQLAEEDIGQIETVGDIESLVARATTPTS